MIKQELNKCNSCGEFKSWDKLVERHSDSDDCGNYDSWFDCTECFPNISEEPTKELTNE